MLHDAVRPEMVHVGQVVVRGAVGPGLRHQPDAVAEPLWRSHTERSAAPGVLG
jgi:hypothetical protein